MTRISLSALAALALAGCGTSETSNQLNSPAALPSENDLNGVLNATTAQQDVAQLRTSQGASAGSATVTPVADGLALAVTVEGLPPGQHGVHIHMVGRCDAPTFESAGAHWNPSNRQHGLENAQGPHAGDMPNLTVGEDGRGSLEHRLGGNLDNFLDADGSALVVHAAVDDQRTDPSGNSGGRIACGVFAVE